MMALCEAGVESNPDMLEFYFYLAIAYNQAERTDDALNVCLKALTRVTDESNKEMVSNFYAIIGDIYHTKNRNLDAYAAYDSSLVYNPSNIGTLNNYAYYLSLEGKNLKKAYAMSKKTIEAEPDNATYLDTFGWILYLQGKALEAKPFFKHAMLYGGKDSVVIMDHYAEVLFALKEYDLAFLYWYKAQEKNNGQIPDLDERVAKRKKSAGR